VQVVGGDILALDISELVAAEQASDPARGGVSDPAEPAYKVVANIPYNITSAVLRHLLEARTRPQLIVLMVQKEVAQRITAKPGDMSLLSVSVQFYGRPRLIHRVPARAFYPVPKVDSAIIRIDPHPQLPLEPEEVEPFFAVVRAGFGQRRKQLRNSLSHGLCSSAERIAGALAQAGVDSERRAQTLSIGEWVALYRALRGVAP
jgi:16S rRNA (adenine1518-N6/adenine1519-N6)-dimethyltransferase